MFGNNRECASFLVKIANKNNEYTRYGAAHICGLPIRACIQVFGDTYKDARKAVHFLFTNKHCKNISNCLPTESLVKFAIMKKILYAFSIGFFGACGYGIVNMLVAPKADPVIGLSFFAVIFIVCFIIGLFDYDRKMKKKAEEEKRQAEKEQTDRLMREYLEKKLKEEAENGK